MRRSTTTVLAFAALLAFTPARPAAAGVPSAFASTWPRHVLLVGTDAGGTPDPAGRMDFAIFRAGGITEEGYSMVVFDFSQTPGVALCNPQPDPRITVDCATRTARFFVDGHGRATVSLVGRADRSVTGPTGPSLMIFVDGVLFGTVPVATVDEDGRGLGAADNSLWQTDYFADQYRERSDFDGNGALTAADLSLWTTLFFGNGSLTNCATSFCP